MLAFAGYRFTNQLLELEGASEGPDSKEMPGAEGVVTPLVWQKWEEELGGHPDRRWVEFLVRGIRDGFRVGHDQRTATLGERRGGMYETS